MEGQRLAITSSSPPVILPGCDPPLLCFLLSCCQGSDCQPHSLPVSSSVTPGSRVCAQEELLQAAVECVGSAHTTAGLARDKMPCFLQPGRDPLQEAQNSKWEAQFQLLFVTYSKWVQFVPEIVGFMNAQCHNCSPCSHVRHNTTTELICLCWMLLFHCVYFLSMHLSAFGYSAAQRRDWKNSLLLPGLSTRSCDMIRNLFLLRHNLGHHHKS